MNDKYHFFLEQDPIPAQAAKCKSAIKIMPHKINMFFLYTYFNIAKVFSPYNILCTLHFYLLNIYLSRDIYVTGYGKTDHFAHNFKIELLVFKGSVDLKQ